MKTDYAFFILLFVGSTIISCSHVDDKSLANPEKLRKQSWTTLHLKNRSQENLDTSKWDKKLFQQDKETYLKHEEVFQSFPLNKSPFPVAKYDYAVSSVPFTFELNRAVFKGISIGEYENPNSEKIRNKFTLIILTNDKDAEENTLVESRNYPYLTAQGTIKVNNNHFDWVFLSSPDGFSTALVNMKLFDLRFGETIIIYPQKDKSFLYDQLEESPDDYSDLKKFEQAIIQNPKVKKQVNSN